ncbi:hypothetical protein AVEN_172476-1 [Araneus ventricosus]|uniref:Uncharacterized protein n=1 Tax=Araneus ventricosus TaxID=182803 RepID=A0A4Y2E182_ARAVE|nr:hypothetical protein AVEN_172476-1 [Araneus ventricosus]
MKKPPTIGCWQWIIPSPVKESALRQTKHVFRIVKKTFPVPYRYAEIAFVPTSDRKWKAGDTSYGLPGIARKKYLTRPFTTVPVYC